jgi:hypothetical protein
MGAEMGEKNAGLECSHEEIRGNSLLVVIKYEYVFMYVSFCV